MNHVSVSIFILLGSVAARAEVPQIQVVKRLQTPVAAGSMPVLVHAANGQKVLVQIEDLASDKYNVRLVAYANDGSVTSETKLARARAGESLILREVKMNEVGDLVALISYDTNSGTAGRLYSENLTNHSDVLISEGSFPSLVDRKRVGQTNFALVSSDLGEGPNGTRPELIRLIDEDKGTVISQSVIDNGVSGKLGVDSAGHLKALLFGYELFGLMDGATGNFVNLLPPRVQPSEFPAEVHLTIGDFIELASDAGTRLLDRAALFDGQLKEDRAYNGSVNFLGDDIAVEHLVGGLRITQLSTGLVLGPTIPDSADSRALRSVDSVINTPQGWIAVVAEPKKPDSYLPGVILNYVQLATGNILRTVSSDKISVTSQLLVMNRRAVGVEQTTELAGQKSLQVIDLASNKIIASTNESLLIPALLVPKQNSPSLIGVVADSNDHVCAIDLLQPKDRTCVADPLVSPAVSFGYTPSEVNGNQIILPLLRKSSEYRYDSLGYIEFVVN